MSAPVVVFTDLGEFLAELARDVELVHRRIVRVSFRSSTLAGMVRRIELLAGYEAGGAPVTLRLPCGDYWGPEFRREDRKDAVQVAEERRDELVAALRDLGLDVRGGTYVATAS